MVEPTKPPQEFQTFSFEGLDLRVVDKGGSPWFVAQDVCDCLQVLNPSQAVRPLDADEKAICSRYNLGTDQDMLVVSEVSTLSSFGRAPRRPSGQAVANPCGCFRPRRRR